MSEKLVQSYFHMLAPKYTPVLMRLWGINKWQEISGMAEDVYLFCFPEAHFAQKSFNDIRCRGARLIPQALIIKETDDFACATLNVDTVSTF